MAISVVRVNAPIKGINTVSPIREMPKDYAVTLNNVWFDQAGGANRRAGQSTIDSAAPAASTTFRNLIEHYSIAGVSSIFASISNNNVYSFSGGAWTSVAAIAGVFTAKPRYAQLGNVLVAGDGAVTRSYNGSVWAALTCATTLKMNSFCTYNGRMYGTGNPADIGIIYYSKPISDVLGATSWNSNTGGTDVGFISVYGALKRGENVVAVAEYSGYLVAFCSNSIVLYQGTDPNDPSTFRVAKVIDGIGCFSADSVQGVGNEMVFLSNYGFKSMKEILVRGDAAASDSSFAINNYVTSQIASGSITTVSSTFAERLGIYLCTFGFETLAYHVAFDCWTSWNGVQKVLLTTKAGVTYTATNRLHSMSTASTSDQIDGAVTSYAVPMVVEFAPFHSPSVDQKSRWNKIGILYEGVPDDTILVSTWTDLNSNYTTTDTVVLQPEVPAVNATAMLWTGTASANIRTAWGTASTGASWAGVTAGREIGDEKLPVIGKGELFSVKIENNNKTSFRLLGVEAFFNQGGIRK